MRENVLLIFVQLSNQWKTNLQKTKMFIQSKHCKMFDWQLFRNFKYSVFYIMFAVSMDKIAESEKCFQTLKTVNLNDNFTSTVISKIELSFQNKTIKWHTDFMHSALINIQCLKDPFNYDAIHIMTAIVGIFTLSWGTLIKVRPGLAW